MTIPIPVANISLSSSSSSGFTSNQLLQEYANNAKINNDNNLYFLITIPILESGSQREIKCPGKRITRSPFQSYRRRSEKIIRTQL